MMISQSDCLTLNSLPTEILTHIIKHLDTSINDFNAFSRASRRINTVCSLEASICEVLLSIYGPQMVLYYTLRKHFPVFDRRTVAVAATAHTGGGLITEMSPLSTGNSLLKRLELRGACFPRFLAQMCLSHCSKLSQRPKLDVMNELLAVVDSSDANIIVVEGGQEREGRTAEVAADDTSFGGRLLNEGERQSIMPFLYIIKASLGIYKMEDLTLNDVSTFEYLSNNLPVHFKEISNLIRKELFVPLPELTPSAVSRIFEMFQRADKEVLFFILTNQRALMREINDDLLAKVLSHLPDSVSLLKMLVARGFVLTPDVLKAQLRSSCAMDVLDCLQEVTPLSNIKLCAFQLLWTTFGPNGHFSPDVTSTLIDNLQLSEAQIHLLLLHGADHAKRLPYQTRCFEQETVMMTWNWILEKYGGDHIFSEYCFDDLLLWVCDDSSPLRTEFFSADSVCTLLLAFSRSSDGMLQPRHLEKLKIMAEMPIWEEVVVRLLKEKQEFIEGGGLHSDPDGLWIWGMALRQIISAFETNMPRRPLFYPPLSESPFILQLRSCERVCKSLLHGSSNLRVERSASSSVSPTPKQSLDLERSKTNLPAASVKMVNQVNPGRVDKLVFAKKLLPIASKGAKTARYERGLPPLLNSGAHVPRAASVERPTSPLEGVFRFFRRLSLGGN